MSYTATRSGFSIIELIVIIVVIAIIGLLGWTGYNAWQGQNTVETTTATGDVTSDAESLPTVTNASDLDDAMTAVEDVNPDSLDTTAIDETLE